jgi:hypothetical protein
MPNTTSAGDTAGHSADILESLASSDCMLTAKELAKLLAMSPKTLYSYVSRNLILTTRLRRMSGSAGRTSRSGYAAMPRDITSRIFRNHAHTRATGRPTCQHDSGRQ